MVNEGRPSALSGNLLLVLLLVLVLMPNSLVLATVLNLLNVETRLVLRLPKDMLVASIFVVGFISPAAAVTFVSLSGSLLQAKQPVRLATFGTVHG